MNQLTIVIVTFNSAQIIASCLEKINNYNVIVVDNASSDQTCLIIKKNFPNVKLIENGKNIGYGRGNNLALKQVQTDYALILNPDAFIFAKDIDIIINELNLNKQIAIAAPLLLNQYPHNNQQINDQLTVANKNLISQHQGFSYNFLAVKYIIGAVVFLRMAVFRQIGFFDEKIFLYYEDDEITHRAIVNGYLAVIFPQAFAYHIGNGSSGSSLRILYKRFWHRALSKFYWKEKQKSKNKAIFSAIKMACSFLLRAMFFVLLFRQKAVVKNAGSFMGTMAYLFRLTAFDKNDNARG